MTKHEADVIDGLNMTDQISNEVYKQIMIAAQDENEIDDVLDKIKGYINHIRNTGLGKKKSLEFIKKYIDGLKAEREQSKGDAISETEKLPLITPQLKTGKWTPGDPICPCCGEDKFKDLDADIWSDWRPKYCPNCGAKMIAESEAQDADNN